MNPKKIHTHIEQKWKIRGMVNVRSFFFCKRVSKKFLYISMVFLCFFYPAKAICEEKNILILHSYNQNFPWTKNVMDGMQSVFDNSDIKSKLSIEYMDSKRYPPNISFGYLENYYLKKYKRHRF